MTGNLSSCFPLFFLGHFARALDICVRLAQLNSHRGPGNHRITVWWLNVATKTEQKMDLVLFFSYSFDTDVGTFSIPHAQKIGQQFSGFARRSRATKIDPRLKREAERTAARVSDNDVFNAEAADYFTLSWQSWDKHQESPSTKMHQVYHYMG